jgi:hypothetical protein
MIDLMPVYRALYVVKNKCMVGFKIRCSDAWRFESAHWYHLQIRIPFKLHEIGTLKTSLSLQKKPYLQPCSKFCHT